MLIYNTHGLKGQAKVVAEALLKHGFIDKEYALLNRHIRNIHDVVMRLRRRGWDIVTDTSNTSKLYTLRRDVKGESGLLISALTNSIRVDDRPRAIAQARMILNLLKNS